jgi:hypothetical protein
VLTVNLISLTYSILVPQFDGAVWVPVQKYGQYLVHFLHQEPNLVERYHFEGKSLQDGGKGIEMTGMHILGRLLCYCQ